MQTKNNQLLHKNVFPKVNKVSYFCSKAYNADGTMTMKDLHTVHSRQYLLLYGQFHFDSLWVRFCPYKAGINKMHFI